MIAVTVNKNGAQVALIHFFGQQFGDPDEKPGFRVVRGGLPAGVVAGVWKAVLREPGQGSVGKYAYQMIDTLVDAAPPPRSGRRR
jgi:hypothetical protein